MRIGAQRSLSSAYATELLLAFGLLPNAQGGEMKLVVPEEVPSAKARGSLWLCKKHGLDLLQKARTIRLVHGRELNRNAVVLMGPANHTEAAHLAYRKVQKKTHQGLQWEGFPCANKETANGEAFQRGNIAAEAGLPSGDRAFRRLHTWVSSLLGSDHSNKSRAGILNLRGKEVQQKTQSNSKFGGGWSFPTRPAAISAL